MEERKLKKKKSRKDESLLYETHLAVSLLVLSSTDKPKFHIYDSFGEKLSAFSGQRINFFC